MARQKKQTIATNVRLDSRSVEYISSYAEENRITKTEAVERIVQEFIDMRSGSLLDEIIRIAKEDMPNERK